MHRYFDDTRRYVENAGLTTEAVADVEECNVRAVYPRLDDLLSTGRAGWAAARHQVSG